MSQSALSVAQVSRWRGECCLKERKRRGAPVEAVASRETGRLDQRVLESRQVYQSTQLPPRFSSSKQRDRPVPASIRSVSTVQRPFAASALAARGSFPPVTLALQRYAPPFNCGRGGRCSTVALQHCPLPSLARAGAVEPSLRTAREGRDRSVRPALSWNQTRRPDPSTQRCTE